MIIFLVGLCLVKNSIVIAVIGDAFQIEELPTAKMKCMSVLVWVWHQNWCCFNTSKCRPSFECNEPHQSKINIEIWECKWNWTFSKMFVDRAKERRWTRTTNVKFERCNVIFIISCMAFLERFKLELQACCLLYIHNKTNINTQNGI